jgi:hypothetical protein
MKQVCSHAELIPRKSGHTTNLNEAVVLHNKLDSINALITVTFEARQQQKKDAPHALCKPGLHQRLLYRRPTQRRMIHPPQRKTKKKKLLTARNAAMGINFRKENKKAQYG